MQPPTRTIKRKRLQPPKRIAVDFDGTLCEQQFPGIGNPRDGAREALAAFRRMGYKVVIWSCRACHWDYDVYGGDPSQPVLERQVVKDMVAWLDEQGIEYDEIDDGSKGKPSAEYYIDDKAIHFDDNWTDLAVQVMRAEIRQSIKDHKTALKPGGAKVLPFVARPQPVPDTDGPKRA